MKDVSKAVRRYWVCFVTATSFAYAADSSLMHSYTGVLGPAANVPDIKQHVKLESRRDVSHPILVPHGRVTFVSFQMFGSQSTVVDVAGVRLGLTAGPVVDSLQLMYDEAASTGDGWKQVPYSIGIDKDSGRTLAGIPTLTIRIDSAEQTWDLYVGRRLMANDLPLRAAHSGDSNFRVRAGIDGARITQLVVSDENPLFADANRNGVADEFEILAVGRQLDSAASKADRQALIQQWKSAQRLNPPAPMLARGALRDRRSESQTAPTE